MAFMIHDIRRTDVVEFDTDWSNSFILPANLFTREEVNRWEKSGVVSCNDEEFIIVYSPEYVKAYEKITEVKVRRNEVIARLSAPGYMDCTDWAGPFASEVEAKKYLDDNYGEEEEENGEN